MEKHLAGSLVFARTDFGLRWPSERKGVLAAHRLVQVVVDLHSSAHVATWCRLGLNYDNIHIVRMTGDATDNLNLRIMAANCLVCLGGWA